jgi:hypothetical protein
MHLLHSDHSEQEMQHTNVYIWAYKLYYRFCSNIKHILIAPC